MNKPIDFDSLKTFLKSFLWPEERHIVICQGYLNGEKQMLLLCDIDGVLADVRHLLPLIQGKDKNFDEYYSRIGEAVYMPDLYQFVGLGFSGHRFYITGRNQSCRHETLNWLQQNDLWHEDDRLYMRLNHDHRPAHKVKNDVVNAIKQEFDLEHMTVLAIDDDPEVCEMYKSHGFSVLQVHHEAAKSA